MAKAPPKPPAEGEEAPPANKGKKLLVILLVLVLLLVIAAGGVLFLLVSKNKHADEASAAEHESAPPKVVVDKTKPPTFVPLEPFTVNLAPDEGDHYLQTTLVFKVADAHTGEELRIYMPEIRHRVNLILSSRKPSEVSNTEGREDLADEIMIEANDILGYPPLPETKRGVRHAAEPSGPVLAVLFNSFIIQ
jgi:flagellar FliL protein